MSSPNNGVGPGMSGQQQYMMGPPLLANAGHHGDMSHVWTLVEELSGLLQSNREQWHQLEDRIAAQGKKSRLVPVKGTDENDGADGTNGIKSDSTAAETGTGMVESVDAGTGSGTDAVSELPARPDAIPQPQTRPSPQAQTQAQTQEQTQAQTQEKTQAQKQEKTQAQTQSQLQNRPAQPTREQLVTGIGDAERHISTLERAYQEQSDLIVQYENGLQFTTAKLRTYIYEQQQATLAIHSHYTSLLQASRTETLKAQLTHQAWQSSFARVSENLRMALNEHTGTTTPYRARIAALKAENRLLRRRVGMSSAVGYATGPGLDEWSDSDSSEDDVEIGLVTGAGTRIGNGSHSAMANGVGNGNGNGNGHGMGGPVGIAGDGTG